SMTQGSHAGMAGATEFPGRRGGGHPPDAAPDPGASPGRARGDCWKRWHTCLIIAGVATLAAWWFVRVQNGFSKVAGWGQVPLPGQTAASALGIVSVEAWIKASWRSRRPL